MNTCYRFGLFVSLALSPLWAPIQSGAAAAAAPPPASRPAGAPLLCPDAAEAVKLARSAVSEDVVLAFIKKCPRTYDLSADDVMYLKNSGLSEAVVTAMLDHDKALQEQRFLASKAGKRAAAARLAAASGPPPSVVVVTSTVPNAMASAAIPPAPKSHALKPAFPSSAPKNPPPPKQPRSWTSSIIVEQAPPPPELEIQPLPPSPDHVWVPGHWTWHEASWLWKKGEWVERPAPGMVWVDGHWSQHGRSYIWIPGHWRS